MVFHTVAVMKDIIKVKLIVTVKAENAVIESFTTNTIFHGMKMPVVKAFI